MFLFRISLVAILLLFVCTVTNAQENLEGENYFTPMDQEKLDKAELVVSSMDDPCAINWDFSTEIIKYSTFSKVRLQSSLVGAPFSIRRQDGSELTKGKIVKDYQVLTVKEEGDFFVYSYDKCGDKVVAATFTTLPRKKDDFTKTSLLQQLLYNGQPLKDRSANIGVLPGEADFVNNKSLMDDCQCTLVRLSMNYTVEPSNGTINRNIWGIYGSNTNQRFDNDDIQANQYWAYEGPSRYQSMFMQTTGCSKAPYEFFWNRNTVTQGTPEGENEPLLPGDLTASLEFNWVCRNSFGRPADCDCDRNMFFDWDYQSVVNTKAETLSGGGWFCGSNRNARASAIDVMNVSYAELNDASAYQQLAFLTNGQVSTCSQTYNGPEIEDFLEFAFTIYQFTQGPPSSGTGGQTQEQIETEWENNLISTAINQIGDALDEPWLRRTPCQVELGGQRRTLLQAGESRNFSVTLRQNNPIRITLAAAGVYFLNAVLSNGRIISKKIMVR